MPPLSLSIHDTTRQSYKKLVVREVRVEGVVLYGDVTDSSWYLDLLRSREDITPFKDAALFGQAQAPLAVGCQQAERTQRSDQHDGPRPGDESRHHRAGAPSDADEVEPP